MKLTCFDYDGVLADTLDHPFNLLKKAWLELSLGREPLMSDIQLIENLAYEPMAKRLCVPDDQLDTYKNFIHTNLQNESNDILFPGIKEMISKLSSISKIAVITSNSQHAVRRTLSGEQMGHDILIYDGFMGLTKGERILLATEQYSIDTSTTFMIGDSRSDIKYGKTAGVKTIAVTWGYQNKETLSKESPDYFVDTPLEILSIIT